MSTSNTETLTLMFRGSSCGRMASNSEGEQTVFCRDCGAEIRLRAEICPGCGIRQRDAPESSSPASSGGDLTEHYSIAVWIVSLLFGLLTFPIGLITPIYLYIKASNKTGKEQGTWESWTVVLTGIVGIIAVELGGETGAKILWGLIGGLFLLFILVISAAAV